MMREYRLSSLGRLGMGGWNRSEVAGWALAAVQRMRSLLPNGDANVEWLVEAGLPSENTGLATL